jgi:hypothetical protein
VEMPLIYAALVCEASYRLIQRKELVGFGPLQLNMHLLGVPRDTRHGAPVGHLFKGQ